MTVEELISLLTKLENQNFNIVFEHEFPCEIDEIVSHNNTACIYTVKLK